MSVLAVRKMMGMSRQASTFFDALAGLEARQLGHHHVQQDKVGSDLLDDVERLVAVRGDAQHIALSFRMAATVWMLAGASSTTRMRSVMDPLVRCRRRSSRARATLTLWRSDRPGCAARMLHSHLRPAREPNGARLSSRTLTARRIELTQLLCAAAERAGGQQRQNDRDRHARLIRKDQRKSEHDRAWCCRAMGPVGQLPASSFAQESKAQANVKWLVLLRAGLEFANFLRRDRENRLDEAEARPT